MNDWNKYIDENAISIDTAWVNTIHYMFATLKDGWVAIFEIGYNGQLYPQIQASDMAHAESWCTMREPLTVPISAIC